MNTETFAQTSFGKLFVKLLASGMESKFRYRYFPPLNIIKGAGMESGQSVLEIGCGTGFFTIPTAKLIGDKGSLTAIDILQGSVDLVSQKVKDADLKNVRVIKCNALDTHLDSQSFHTVLLFGVIPAPMIPLNSLLTELHRVLKEGGCLAVWPHIPGWLPEAILKSGLFSFTDKRMGVNNFKRLECM
jgi:ubiquinone/menaquinone biosynthesis C-methylase UbiE